MNDTLPTVVPPNPIPGNPVMHLVHLIYVSRFTPVCDTVALRNILAVSRAYNNQHDITGLLCYDPEFFMQWLEGPRAEVNRLYHNIINDPRHRDAQIITYADISDRAFRHWSMAYISARNIDAQLIAQYCPHARFEPYSMGAVIAREFMLAAARAHARDNDRSLSKVH